MSIPFERELRRVSSQKVAPKQQVLTELGTSVAPRQRPKGNVSSQNLPLVLPSSPSPRNTPSLQVLPNNDANIDVTDKSNSISQIPTPASPYAIQTKANALQIDLKTPTRASVNENIFEATFSENFIEQNSLPQIPTSSGSKTEISSPTSPIHQNTPKILASGHRRNMSDTTAFNKYFHLNCILIFYFQRATNCAT